MAALVLCGIQAHAQWEESHLATAIGQTVYWNAWGGDERINAYIDWVGDQVEETYGVRLRHVRMSNTADAVAGSYRGCSWPTANRGSIDLIWINVKILR